MTNASSSQPEKFGRLLSRLEVEQLTRLSRSTIYRQIEAGQFPRPIRVGTRAVAWWESDVEKWRKSRPDNNPAH